MSGLPPRLGPRDAVEMLKLTMISRAQGDEIDDGEYRRLREAVLSNPEVARRVPGFARTCSNARLFWAFIREQSASYQGRRDFLRDAFAPVLAYLDGAQLPGDEPRLLERQPLDSGEDVLPPAKLIAPPLRL